ncbi:MAG TPA: hypothetical protein VFK82_00765 [Burkholderiaceae bacterium]|nr:hypothetical protein [Burkholderiaceae bacterium]
MKRRVLAFGAAAVVSIGCALLAVGSMPGGPVLVSVGLVAYFALLIFDFLARHESAWIRRWGPYFCAAVSALVAIGLSMATAQSAQTTFMVAVIAAAIGGLSRIWLHLFS